VIHSFWVPKLAGKLDAVPGRENRMWFNATKPGSYSGQCAEFCGLGHADMRLVVVAESEEDFQAWVADQLAGGAASAGSGSDELVSGGE
jgi:cytochrome c oxidase subunit 2